MTGSSLRRAMTRRLIIAGAAMAVLVPAVAYATSPSVTVETPGATLGPTGAFSEISTDAACASGSYVSGGGIDQAIGTGMSSNGNHVMGSEPSSNGSTEPLGGTPPVTNAVGPTGAAYWLGIGGSGGMVNSSFSTTPYAMCLSSTVVTGNEVIVSSIAGTGLAVATCPSGTKLLGGGARATPASTGSMKPIAGYPTFSSGYDNGALAAKDGDPNPDSWAAYGNNGGMSGTLDTYVFAICGTGSDLSGVSTKVHFLEHSGPSSGGQTETVGCGGDGLLLSGGAAISGGNVTTVDFTVPDSQGDHLNGSYPSDSSGNPLTSGTTTTTTSYWTAYTHTGGSPTSPYSDVWALCGSGL